MVVLLVYYTINGDAINGDAGCEKRSWRGAEMTKMMLVTITASPRMGHVHVQTTHS